MNRSILIVICDFIVSSMLTLSTGLVPSDSPFGAGGSQVIDEPALRLLAAELRQEQQKLEAARVQLIREQRNADSSAQLQELERKLAETQAKVEFLEQRRSLRPENAGALSPEALQKQLEEEIQRRALLKVRNESARYELEELRRLQQETSSQLLAARESLARTQEQLSGTRESLDQARQEAAGKTRELAQAGEQLTRTREQLTRTQEQLAGRDARLTELQGDLQQRGAQLTSAQQSAQQLQRQIQTVQTDLAFVRGRATTAEKELAEAQSRYERAQRQIQARELELAEARKQVGNLQLVVKNAVSDLSRAKGELEEARKRETATAAELTKQQTRAGAAEQKLAHTQELLQEAEEKLRDNVLESYAEAVVELSLAIHERRLVLDVKSEPKLYLPLVRIGDRNVLVSDTRLLTGNQAGNLTFERVSRLSYLCSVPELAEGRNGGPVPGPLYILPGDPRIALLPLPELDRKPLPVLGWEELKQRGIQDLYLFKTESFGKESALLNGRCSINFSAGDEALYIRNAARGTGSELRAEIGDLVLTKQGQLVGVIVSQENFDLGRRQEARCAVLPTELNWKQMTALPFTPANAEGIYEEFGSRARAVTREIERNEDRFLR